MSILSTVLAYSFFVIYCGLIIAYSTLILLSLVWGIKISLYQLFKPENYRRQFPTRPNGGWINNILLNDLFGIFIIFLPFLLLSMIPDGVLSLDFVPFIVALGPYALGFYRSTGVGIHCGVIGTLLGLTVLHGFPSYPPRLEEVFYYPLMVLMANISGWLGGAVGMGQVLDSKSIIVLNLRVADRGTTLDELIHLIRDQITATLPQKAKCIVSPPTMTVAQDRNAILNTCAILKFERRIRWRDGYIPIIDLFKKLFTGHITQIKYVLDAVSNLSRNMVVDFVISSNADQAGSCGNYRIAIITYRETPSIVWVDREIEEISRKVYQNVRGVLTQAAPQDQPQPWEIATEGHFVMRYWQKPTLMEQYTKDTPGSQDSQTYIGQANLISRIDCGVDVISQFSQLPTVFDRLRGTIYSFIFFLFAQLGVGMLVNGLYDVFKQGL